MLLGNLGLGAVAATVFLLPVGALASGNTSSYSDLDFDKCEIVQEDSEFGLVEWRCAGALGYDVLATEADLRLYLAYQRTGDTHGVPVDNVAEGNAESEEVEAGERSLGQTIGPFNNLGAKLEWRHPNAPDAEPYATIVRYLYQIDIGDGTEMRQGQALVVSRFRKGESCHVAIIDALANADANVMAREVADKYATSGSCPEGAAPVLGKGGDDLR